MTGASATGKRYLQLHNAGKSGFAGKAPLLLAGCFLVLLTAGSLLSDSLLSLDPFAQGDILIDRYRPPSAKNLFGTDKFGRDLLARTLYGAKISLLIALGVVALSLSTGISYGLVSGYFGGWVDRAMMLVLDFMLAFPAIFLLMFLLAVFQAGHWMLIPILGFTGWMETARLVRAEVLSVRERDFVHAAIGMGYTRRRVLLNHILPNVLAPVLISIPFKVAEVILLESALSFLGIGVQPPVPSWGNLINDGRGVLLSAWWISSIPALFITLTALGFHAIGDYLRRHLEV